MKQDKEIVSKALELLKSDAKSMLGNDAIQEIERAKKGVVVMYDMKDVDMSGTNELFIADTSFGYAMHETFFNDFMITIEDEEDDKIYSAKELNAEYQEWQSHCCNDVFYRFRDDREITWQETLEICKEINFHYPDAIVVNGEFNRTVGLDRNTVHL